MVTIRASTSAYVQALKIFDRIYVCSVHFEDDCFTTSKEVAKEVGKRLRLKPDAVPTVDAANEPQEEQTLLRTARERVSVFAIMLC